MKTDLPKRFSRQLLPEPGGAVLCAVSGGLDSMCLLHMLNAWCSARGGSVVAAHFNHQLRGAAADRDETFVRSVCAQWAIPLTVGRGDVRRFAAREGLSIEEAARIMRYAFLKQTAETEACSRVYTAHHADDNAETILLNLVRGTGLAGLTGMEAQRDGIFRPLLNVTRLELADYAAAHSIPYTEDETNTDPDAAARNLIRLRVMPLLRQLNPRAAEHMNGTAGQLRAINQSIEEEARRLAACAEVQNGRVSLSLDVLDQAPDTVKPRVLLHLFDLLGTGRKDLGTVHLTALLELTQRSAQERERRLSLPHGVTAQCCRRRLVLAVRPQVLAEIPLVPEQPLRWGRYLLTLLTHPEGPGLALRMPRAGEDAALTVGPCPPGGRLALSGSRGTRSVKRLCVDHRISLEERDGLPAIYAGEKLAAIWRLGVDIEFLPEGSAVRFIKIIQDREADGS